MGKASTNKKVARAAGISGGRSHRRNRPWGYYGVIALIVLLGVVGTVQSRDRRLNQITSNGDTPPTVGTVWNEGYAVYACGKFLQPISITSKDPEGITTRELGIIDIHPTTKSAAGKNATLGKFASAVGMKLNAAELQVPGGKLYSDGDSCEGQPGHVYVKQFANLDDAVGQLFDGAKGQQPKLDPAQVPLNDKSLLTIAFVPGNKAASIPPPPGYVDTNLSKLEASSSKSSSTSPPVSTTTKSTTPTTKPSSATTVAKS
jgi:hypothetical protein